MFDILVMVNKSQLYKSIPTTVIVTDLDHNLSNLFNFHEFQVCPICAAAPGGDPNHVTDNFMAHMMLEHRTEQTIISFVDIN